MFLFKVFIMTFKKINKIGQAIFEYFILTTIVMAVVLFFSANRYFVQIKRSCNTEFNAAVNSILQ